MTFFFATIGVLVVVIGLPLIAFLAGFIVGKWSSR